MLNKKSGFSLVELMVVIVIVAILAGVSIPVYNVYRLRSAMAEAHGIINKGMKRWEEAYSMNDYSFPEFGTNVSHTPYLQTYLATTYVTYTFAANNFKREGDTYVVYTPTVASDGVITWSCDVDGVAGSYYGGFTLLEFQETYFPDCTCNNC